MLIHSPNDGALRLPNDDDDDSGVVKLFDVYVCSCPDTTLAGSYTCMLYKKNNRSRLTTYIQYIACFR